MDAATLEWIAVTDATARALLAGVLMFGAILIAGVALMWIRRRRAADEDRPADLEVGFTLDGIRQMHRAGKISDQEFQALRAQVIQAAQRAGLVEHPHTDRAETPTSGSRPPAGSVDGYGTDGSADVSDSDREASDD